MITYRWVPKNMAETQHQFPYDVVFAHGPGCNDGAVAAWAFWRTFPAQYTDKLADMGGFYSRERSFVNPPPTNPVLLDGIQVHPNSPCGGLRLLELGFPTVFVFVQPGEAIPINLVKNRNVLLIDLDMGALLVDIVREAKRVYLVDHHDSSQDTISKYARELSTVGDFDYTLDTRKSESAATLMWKLTHYIPVPPLVEIVRIGDTWQWNDFPELHAREVLKGLRFEKRLKSFYEIEETFQTWSVNAPFYQERGNILSVQELALAKQIAKQCDIGCIRTNDNKEYIVAFTQANIMHSEVGAIMKKYAINRFRVPIDFCATWKYSSYRGIVSVSLRDPSEGINLAQIARSIEGTYGEGGGHSGAASFSFYGLVNFHRFIRKRETTAVND